MFSLLKDCPVIFDSFSHDELFWLPLSPHYVLFWMDRQKGEEVQSCTDGMPSLGCSPEIGGCDGWRQGLERGVSGLCQTRGWWLWTQGLDAFGSVIWMLSKAEKTQMKTINNKLVSVELLQKEQIQNNSQERDRKCKNTISQVPFMARRDFLSATLGWTGLEDDTLSQKKCQHFQFVNFT